MTKEQRRQLEAARKRRIATLAKTGIIVLGAIAAAGWVFIART